MLHSLDFDKIKDIFLIAFTAIVGTANLILVFRFRKKDFQIAVLKEQFEAYNKLLENLFQTSELLRQAYNKEMGEKLLRGIAFLNNPDELETVHRLIFVNFGSEYTASFSRSQSLMFLLPEDVIVAVHEYYRYVGDLFENNSEDPELGVKLSTEVNQKVFDVMNVIRQHLAIDSISKETRKLFASDKQFSLNMVV